MLLHKFSLVLMCALIFYFVNRSHSKFKFKFESMEFENLEGCKMKKVFSIGFADRFPTVSPAGQLAPSPHEWPN
jgi:hypothetical protein